MIHAFVEALWVEFSMHQRNVYVWRGPDVLRLLVKHRTSNGYWDLQLSTARVQESLDEGVSLTELASRVYTMYQETEGQVREG